MGKKREITGEDHRRVKNYSMKNFLENRWKLVLLCIFIFSMSLRLWSLNQIGRTWDEELYISQGHKLIQLLKKGDFNNSYFYTTYDHPPLVKYLYGLTAQLDLEKVEINKPIFNYDFTFSRLLSAFLFSVGVVLTVIIGWRIYSFRIGIIAGIILAMLPFTLGLSQLVTAESFKILIYPLSIYTFILLLQKFSIKNIILCGISVGIALQIKQSNILILPIFGIIFLFQYKQLKEKDRSQFLKSRLKAILTICLISIITFLLIWPQLLWHLGETYAIHKSLWNVQFSPKIWQITLAPPEIFMGKLMISPVFYYPVYFLISIPIGILILFFIGLMHIIKKISLYHFILLAWFLVPFIMSFYSWRQHGLRYIIEVYPAICLIAAIGFDRLVTKYFKQEKKRFVYFIPVVIYLFVVLWQIKPYYLDYFNEIVGGTNTVYKYRLFQQGWWGQGLREAGLYLRDNAPKGSSIGLAISPDHVFPRFDKFRYSDWSPNKKYDYVIVNYYHIIRDGFDDGSIRKSYNLIYNVKADDATLVYVYRRK